MSQACLYGKPGTLCRVFFLIVLFLTTTLLHETIETISPTQHV